ncbi:MAG: phosphatidylserine decarboxylase family protein, partial [Acetobacter fabarum]
MSLLASLKLVVARPHPEARPFFLASGAVSA